jgi:hypothetical protein
MQPTRFAVLSGRLMPTLGALSGILCVREREMEESFMKILQEIEQLLAKTTRAEKAQVLQWIVRDLGDAFPGVESIPNE